MWRQRRQRRERQEEPPPCDVATECDLFLRGRYVEQLRIGHRPVPTWVRMNVLAHGTPAELGRLRPATGLDPESEWATATSYLAGEILGAVGGDPDRLRDLQLQVLIPLELRLAIRWQVAMRPPQLVQLVAHELERCR